MATKSRRPKTGQEAVTALIAKARAAARHAYAPYSGFAVGAVVETTDGAVFSGANMESASFGLSVCAEVGALQAASSAGQLGTIKTLVVVSGPIHPPAGYQPQPAASCGRCRQLISEAAMLGGRDIDVWFADLSGHKLNHKKISQLLPNAFGPQNLE
jgi:cytidine deaminase